MEKRRTYTVDKTSPFYKQVKRFVTALFVDIQNRKRLMSSYYVAKEVTVGDYSPNSSDILLMQQKIKNAYGVFIPITKQCGIDDVAQTIINNLKPKVEAQ